MAEYLLIAKIVAAIILSTIMVFKGEQLLCDGVSRQPGDGLSLVCEPRNSAGH